MSTTVSYDFVNNNVVSDVAHVCSLAQVTPVCIMFRDTSIDNVTIEFDSRDDAIRFTEEYLGSDDPADIQEYVPE